MPVGDTNYSKGTDYQQRPHFGELRL
jgi:hypothetical protein